MHDACAQVRVFISKKAPLVTPEQCFSKINEEMAEYLQDPSDPEEAVDVIIALIAYFSTLGINLAPHFYDKMLRNMQRDWEIIEDAHGERYHSLP